MNPSAKIYFPGLNGLRAIAAGIVLVIHIDQFTPVFGLTPISFKTGDMAGHAVTLFFVLSGFLITFLLLREKDLYTRIDLRKFYTRRILRIWPIYYLIIVLSLIAIPLVPTIWYKGPLWASTGLYIFMLANVAYQVNLTITTLVPLWSVGVEEQFYAIWPVLMNRSRTIWRALLLVIVIQFLIKMTARTLGYESLYLFLLNLRIECMALGGIGALLVYKQSPLCRWLYNPLLQIACWLFFFYSVLFQPFHIASAFDDDIYACIFLVLVLNVSSNPRTLVNLENRFFDSIGRVSYGIYVYHMLVIYLIAYVLKNHLPDGWLGYAIVYFVPISVTLLVSYLSFEFFESRFIKLKHNVSRVESRASRFST